MNDDGDGDDIEKKNGKQQLSVIVIGVSNAFYLRSLPVATHTHTHTLTRSFAHQVCKNSLSFQFNKI